MSTRQIVPTDACDFLACALSKALLNKQEKESHIFYLTLCSFDVCTYPF